MYFNVADPYYFDERYPLQIQWTYYDDGFETMILQYDSHNANATLNGAYTGATPVQCTHSKTWKTVTRDLPNARFANRENSGSDFRFAVRNGWLGIKEIIISKQKN
jgi:hypothetical protein